MLGATPQRFRYYIKLPEVIIMADYAISAANLSRIENNLETIYRNIDVLNSNIDQVNGNVAVVYQELGALAEEFHDFVDMQVKEIAKAEARTELIRIRQEMEKKFGHYDEVRRHTTGILQADDLGFVKKNTI